MTIEAITMLKIFATMGAVFGPIIALACWYNARQERMVAASKPMTYSTCAPSRSQMMQPCANIPETRISAKPNKINININMNFVTHIKNAISAERYRTAASTQHVENVSQEKWTVLTPKEIARHSHQHQLPEESSAAKLTHELFRKSRRCQDA